MSLVSENKLLLGPLKNGLLFLFNLAWASRTRLPVLIAIGFMVMDIRMQLEINVDLSIRRIPRFQEEENNINDSDTESNSLWETEEEEDQESTILTELEDNNIVDQV